MQKKKLKLKKKKKKLKLKKKKLKLKKKTVNWKPLGMNDKIPIGKFKNCRVCFIMQQYPLELQEAIRRKFLFVTKDVETVLEKQMKKLEWKKYLLK